ncbi:SCARECROW-like 13 [Striga hermonthica]|uniref:SCARECROW-like 13 n=1 Tax=Striga hermonthica TaxID=68872 RepID=A0A9N7MXJ1_STRHE|nr:SCARECROW-like 13 [Striga hermonthica]
MRAPQESQSSTHYDSFYSRPTQHANTYGFPTFQILNNDSAGTKKGKGTEVSFQACTEQFFTLESTPLADFPNYSSSSGPSVSSGRSPLSPPGSQSYASDFHHTPVNTDHGSPLSGSSGVEDDNKLLHALWVLRHELLGPESETDDSGFYNGMAAGPPQPSSPFTRLGAYMLEGLRARLLSSGSIIYKKLKCKEPTSSELMSYMHVIYQICPYYKFAYISSNAIISEAMENERRIHIIDFQIAQGSQWVSLIQALARRPGGPPFVRITGVDDSDSAHARGGGLELVGRRLSQVAESCGVPFVFHGSAMSGCEVQLENLNVQHEEALAVNFPYVLHHMPDESVSTTNHRDRLLRLVKGLSPKVVTLVEQESNTNTSTFFQRFCETLDYYTAMFESIDDAARARDDGTRISAEEHCVAKDVVNIISCEGVDRVERHELFGKWRLRLAMAGFAPVQLGPSIGPAIRDMLKEYSSNYGLAEANGALYLGWKNRALATCSAWR